MISWMPPTSIGSWIVGSRWQLFICDPKIDPLLLDHVWIWGGRWHATCCWSYLVFFSTTTNDEKITLLEETLLTMYSCCIVRSNLRTIIILPSEELNGKATLSHRTAVRLTTWQRAYKRYLFTVWETSWKVVSRRPLIIDGPTFGQKKTKLLQMRRDFSNGLNPSNLAEMTESWSVLKALACKDGRTLPPFLARVILHTPEFTAKTPGSCSVKS